MQFQVLVYDENLLYQIIFKLYNDTKLKDEIESRLSNTRAFNLSLKNKHNFSKLLPMLKRWGNTT